MVSRLAVVVAALSVVRCFPVARESVVLYNPTSNSHPTYPIANQPTDLGRNRDISITSIVSQLKEVPLESRADTDTERRVHPNIRVVLFRKS
jgi:hypothetical protein